jgi:cell wall-associated NlpC family hydrolase
MWRNSVLPRVLREPARGDAAWRPARRRLPRRLALLAAALLAVGAGAFAADELATGGRTSHARAALANGHRGASAAASRGGASARVSSRAAAHAIAGSAAARTGAGTHGAAASHGASASASRGARAPSAEVRDPEEARSFPVPARVLAHRRSAAAPARAAGAFVAPGALSTAQVRRELARLQALERAQEGAATIAGGDSVGGDGTIPIPPGVPAVIQRVIAGANAITDYPYVYGGGHASFVDNAYDCSGSVSYALAAGGLLSRPETSGELESWGAAGPGQWITIYANEGHVYMYVNIGGGVWMRYDTVGRSGPYASRWQPNGRSNEGFVARHWPGL